MGPVVSKIWICFLFTSIGPSICEGNVSYLFPGGAHLDTADCFKAFPALRKRFSWEQLEYFCQQKRLYESAIGIEQLIEPFTEAQKEYLDSLRIHNDTVLDAHGSAVRQEIRTLTSKERAELFFALDSLQNTLMDNATKLELLVSLHHPALAPGAHVGAAFLPWHREYLRTVETALRRENPRLKGLPYWDSTLDSGLPEPLDSIVWSSGFLGADEPNGTRGQQGNLLSPEDAEFVLSRPNLASLSACVDLRLERSSRGVHEWVGGAMPDIYAAPSDMVFFLFHAHLDHLWELLRSRLPEQRRLFEYPADWEACNAFHKGDAPMRPFQPLRNRDGLSDVYAAFYGYRLVPTDLTCGGSDYLFFDAKSERCLSKIRVGGLCRGLEDSHPCIHGNCVGGRCRLLQNSFPKEEEGSGEGDMDIESLLVGTDTDSNTTVRTNSSAEFISL